MADKYDKMLRHFFSGGLDVEIKMREATLRQTGKTHENIGGGRAKNKQFNQVENGLIKIESDEYLNQLKKQKKDIQQCVDMFSDEHKEVFYQYYRNKLTWQYIAQLHFINESTARRWRDELKRVYARQVISDES
ncbi:DUF722 domain-containing protein [Weissella minor]|uniref:Uncharacterized protein n=1 Tax=Weissella minor TaxID=1620 RepID=A0A0R2JSU2_9LACO|nr:DUF722 domain-containing protein [Weissella minor]KRN77623.1 hypothetical protein IV67_GL001467 [Weissella minor]